MQDEIAAALRQTIINGGQRPSQRLIEAELAEESGVSRALLREAMS